jgi:F-type H+-transporting ATPase subunit b
MKDREKKITKSLDDGQKRLKERLSGAEEDYKRKCPRRKKSQRNFEKASQDAEAKKKEMLLRLKDEIGQVINQKKPKCSQKKAKTLKEIKAEIADLVVATAEKVIGEKMNSKNDQEIIKKYNQNIK